MKKQSICILILLPILLLGLVLILKPSPVFAKNVTIITGAGSGGDSRIKGFDLKGKVSNVNFFAYDKNFSGGVKVAVGDINGDGEDEIITGTGSGGGPQVRVFNSKGKVLLSFLAYSKDFKGGVNVASGDVNGDGEDEIIVGAGPGGGPQVRVFTSSGKYTGWAMFPFHPNFRGGVTVAAGDVDKDGKAEIGVCQASKGEAWCKVYKYNKVHTILGQWRAYPQGIECGANLAMADVNGDGKAEVITGPGTSYSPLVKVFSGFGQYKNIGFLAYSSLFKGGVFVAGSDIDKDKKAEIITGTGNGGGPQIKGFEPYSLY
jgi:hypothetical protein